MNNSRPEKHKFYNEFSDIIRLRLNVNGKGKLIIVKYLEFFHLIQYKLGINLNSQDSHREH